MVHICSNQTVERILKTIRRYICGCDNNTEHTTKEHIINDHMEYITEEYDDIIDDQVSIKERIAKLIKENEKYFIYEVMRTTADTILYDGYCDMERLKTLGYSHRIAVEIFEKHGIFLYATDLSCYIYAPIDVRYELDELIDEYGLDIVAEEIAVYLKENYPDKFRINIVSTQ